MTDDEIVLALIETMRSECTRCPFCDGWIANIDEEHAEHCPFPNFDKRLHAAGGEK